jgi:predicted small lipoprotein YifL
MLAFLQKIRPQCVRLKVAFDEHEWIGSMGSRAKILIGVLLVSATLAGCGRRGPLEPPPGAVAPANVPQVEEDEVDPVALTRPVEGSLSKEGRSIPRPKKPFVLDPIL